MTDILPASSAVQRRRTIYEENRQETMARILERKRQDEPSPEIPGAVRRNRIIMKKSKESFRDKRRPNAALVQPGASRPQPSPSAEAATSERQVPVKPDAAKNFQTAAHSYRFQRARTSGIIEVLNENSYVMAEYVERTGALKWQRIVLASQREQIQKWLENHYPRA